MLNQHSDPTKKQIAGVLITALSYALLRFQRNIQELYAWLVA